MEIELKLALPPRSVRRLLRHALLRGKGSARRVHSVYYDTPALDLLKQDLVFRLRRDGTKWLQAIKGRGSANAGLHQRMEVETVLDSPTPDFAALAATLPAPGAGIEEVHALQARLQPAFITHFNRVTKIVQYKQLVTIEVAIDRGVITSHGRTLPLCELELELKSGPPAALFDFALALLEDIPLAIENRSKAERGYALLCDEAPQPAKSRAPVLAQGVSTIGAFTHIAATLLAQIQANRQGVLEGKDPEYLHQMRVAVRRLRSLLSAYAERLPEAAMEPLLAGIKWLGDALGPARDADVFLTEIWPPLRAALNTNPLLGELDVRWAAEQRAAAAKTRRALGSRRYQHVMLTFGRWLCTEGWRAGASPDQLAAFDVPAYDFARKVIGHHSHKVRKHGDRHAHMDDVQLHGLRIRIKKLRYAVESFGGLFDEAAVRGVVNKLARLQDILGALNDIRVAGRHVANALPDKKRGRAVIALRSGLSAWRDARKAALRRKLHAAWRAYRHAESFC